MSPAPKLRTAARAQARTLALLPLTVAASEGLAAEPGTAVDIESAAWRRRRGTRTPFHIEAIDAPALGAPGKTPEMHASPLVVNFQLRPDPPAH